MIVLVAANGKVDAADDGDVTHLTVDRGSGEPTARMVSADDGVSSVVILPVAVSME